MKIVINKCFGGFSLSRKAVKRIAELQGRKCYFFTNFAPDGSCDLSRYYPSPEPDGNGRDLFWQAFDIPNPNEIIKSESNWNEMTQEERDEANALHSQHSLDTRPDDRTDPLLIQVVEELGVEANGGCAELAIVEIPDGVEWEIDEYDGNEHIAEKHRTWG